MAENKVQSVRRKRRTVPPICTVIKYAKYRTLQYRSILKPRCSRAIYTTTLLICRLMKGNMAMWHQQYKHMMKVDLNC
jgi:predicted GNAT family acetyltransferase